MSPTRSARLTVLFVAFLVLVIDQVTKTLAQENLAHRSIHLIGPLSLALLYNSGVAFSLGSGDTVLATLVEVIVVTGLVLYSLRIRSATLASGFGLVIGGALGNIADRLFRHNHGAVIDFISTGFWPTFNLADTAVVVGIAVILVGSRARRSVARY